MTPLRRTLCPLYYDKIKDHPELKTPPPGGHRHFAMAVMRKSKYLGWNNKKTRPQLARIIDGFTIAWHHAETHVLFKMLPQHRKYAKIYVCRVRKDGKFIMSKPCNNCIATLLAEGVSVANIWYTNNNGEWICLKTNQLDS
jgi:hypothetical protein